jgi:hypothetical protein
MFPVDILRRVTWECVHFSSAHEVDHALDAFNEEGFAVVAVRACAVHAERDLLAVLGRSLQFPEYFGNNWDALDECLADLSWLPAGGYVVCIYGAEQIWRDMPRTIAKLVSAWLFAAERWGKQDVPFHLIFVW